MADEGQPGQIVILNGVPRSGKTSIARVIQDTFEGAWMNIGVDAFSRHVTPREFQPGIGLRPGETGHAAEPMVPVFYAAMYASIAAHSRLGLNVVTDVGHHDSYGDDVIGACARLLAGLPVLFVGVRCPIEAIMERRNMGEGPYVKGSAGDPVPAPVLRWQDAVHAHSVYDLEVDTSVMSAQECAEVIRGRLRDGAPGTAFAEIAKR